MRVLWMVAAGLAVVYLAVWAGTRAAHTEHPTATPTLNTATSGTQLANVAKGDAIARVDPRASLQVDSVKPILVEGDDLHQSVTGGTPGFEIVLVAVLDNKSVSKLTYHAVAPNRAVFVKQEVLK